MKVEFIKGAAPIGLAYSQGNEAEFADAFAMELIDRGYCKPVEEARKTVEVKPEEVKEAVIKTNKKAGK